MKKIASRTVSLACALLIVWFVFSWVDIVADNTQPNPQHSDYNMFVMMARD